MSEADSSVDLRGRIEAVLDRDVRPGLLAEGGDVELVGVDEDRIVQVRLLGSCQGCPSSIYTMTMGIEAAIKGRSPRSGSSKPSSDPRPHMTILDRPSRPAGSGAADSWVWPRAAYVHIPFCAHKCGYCDFASLAGSDHLADRYLDALGREMDALGGPHEVDTIFIGGGTPTRLDARQLDRLLAMVRRAFPIVPGGEWTVEANPGTIDAEKADVLAGGGVNRVSLGAQSFQPDLLRALERNHSPEEVPRALDLVRPRFPFWSFDLIFGVPGLTPRLWADDLETALKLEPSHLSCYGLVYEKGTALWKQERAGLVRPVEEEAERAMYEHTIDRLAVEGLAMYEISNFARAGHESRHNLVYWANDAYFGVGLGAARYVGGVRSSNTRDLPAYLKRLEEGRDATGPTETLDAEARARETAVLMLRRTVLGIDRDDFRRRTGFDLDELAGAALARHVRGGLLEVDARRIRFTREGLFLADTVLCDLL